MPWGSRIRQQTKDVGVFTIAILRSGLRIAFSSRISNDGQPTPDDMEDLRAETRKCTVSPSGHLHRRISLKIPKLRSLNAEDNAK